MSTRLCFQSRRAFTALGALLALAALSARPAPARADVQLGFDLDWTLPIDSAVDNGGGFALRLGSQLHVPAIAITPELVFGYHDFAGRGVPVTYRGVGGLRLGIGEVFRLGPYGHLGVGHIDYDLPGDPHATGFTWDVGAFFDLTLLPLLNLGVHGAYNELNGDLPMLDWVTLGAHAELIF